MDSRQEAKNHGTSEDLFRSYLVEYVWTYKRNPFCTPNYNSYALFTYNMSVCLFAYIIIILILYNTFINNTYIVNLLTYVYQGQIQH